MEIHKFLLMRLEYQRAKAAQCRSAGSGSPRIINKAATI